jgi:antitoxin component YwqK of YwqJK toxin-antitoxin module
MATMSESTARSGKHRHTQHIAIYGENVLCSEQGIFVLPDGRPYSGLAHERLEDHTVLQEDMLVNGMKEGLSRRWHENGRLQQELYYLHDGLHGSCKEWYDTGQLRTEGTFEHGICVTEKEWDPNGTLTKDYRIAEGDQLYSLLLRARRLHAQLPTRR